jgi:hypothetical protein
MSLLSKIKQGVASSGSSLGKIVYTKDGSKIRIRFLQDVEDGMEITLHDHFEKGINAICQETLGKSCPYCDLEEEGWRHRTGYVWSVWDHDAKEVKLFIGYAHNFSHLPALIGMAEAYGNWTDRDYVLSQTGKQLNKQLSVVPMDRAKFKNTKAKPLTKKAILDILDKAYPVNEEDETSKKNGKKKTSKKKQEEPEDDEDENEYEEMTPRELYMECIERGLEAKKKQKAVYYIEILEEDDENNADEEEDEDWEDSEDDEDGEW